MKFNKEYNVIWVNKPFNNTIEEIDRHINDRVEWQVIIFKDNKRYRPHVSTLCVVRYDKNHTYRFTSHVNKIEHIYDIDLEPYMDNAKKMYEKRHTDEVQNYAI
jgi:hypothetical protein